MESKQMYFKQQLLAAPMLALLAGGAVVFAAALLATFYREQLEGAGSGPRYLAFLVLQCGRRFTQQRLHLGHVAVATAKL